MQKFQAVIFDFDYTLGDATEGIVSSVNYGLTEMGHPKAPREDIRKTVGLSLPETYQELTGDECIGQGERFAAYFKEQADRVMTDSTSLLPDALPVLKKLKEQGIRIAIVTTKFHYRIDDILKKCGAEQYFDKIVGADDVKQPKPDPEGVFQVLDAFGTAPEQMLYVGDSVVDAKTAQSAGASFAGVTTGTTSGEQLKEYGYVGIFENLSQLMEKLF